ncbi:hypothetical protein FDA94_01165 [Herbidospora galbida]|uniref:Uncharacterized protein n=1 Tax=Herbidospora galbida TaxID=2575442 RepID=A0A4U3MP44_9ACTN|nr:hypothetical protein [Herbidospora galbida]TKK91428.1 hypothetical protein FDA94_01165 [Herbidospora galbida]
MMVDPRPIRTRADLRTALERLFHADGRSYLKLATAAGIGNSTLHSTVNGDTFPRWDTLAAVLTECGVRAHQMAGWKQAHARARADQSGRPLREVDDRLALQVHRPIQVDTFDGRSSPALPTYVRRAHDEHLGELVDQERPPPGWPLGEVTDPFEHQLEIHRAIQATTGAHAASGELPPLPAYVPRVHDRVLGEVVARAAAGTSQIAVLVGGSSTGKTRACWEALHLLRAQPPDRRWRLWHPIDPTRSDAALADLARIGPYTVVWLNEAQFYLADPTLGERVAAGLRELLRDPSRAPVLLLATLWPKYWDALTTHADPDAHAHARVLLNGRKISVAEQFTAFDLRTMADQAGGDPRLREAAERARGDRITQYLAGVPVLMDRYEQAPPAARALIDVAMDARRLGAGPHLSVALLAGAAPAYLTDTQWDQTGVDWLRQALDYVATPCNGIPGILTAVKPRALPDRRARRPDNTSGAAAVSQARGETEPQYRLADYLDQQGRRHRAHQIPPIHFWTAAAAHAHPSDLKALGDAAWARGLHRDAAHFRKNATTLGDAAAAAALVAHLHTSRPGDRRPACHAAEYAALDDPRAVIRLLNLLHRMGAREQIDMLLARDPAAHVALDNPGVVAGLLERLRKLEAHGQIAVLAERAAAHAALDRPGSVARLLKSLGKPPLGEHAAVLAERAAVHAALDNPGAVAVLLERLSRMGMHDQAAVLAGRAAARIALDRPGAVAALLGQLRRMRAHKQADMLLARQPGAHATLDDLRAVTRLLDRLRTIKAAQDQAAVLAERAAMHAALDDPGAVADLLERLSRMRAHDQAALLAERAAAHLTLDQPGAVTALLGQLRKMEVPAQLTMLPAANPAAQVALDDPGAVARLLARLDRMRAHEQVTVLLARDPAANAALDDPSAVAGLLKQLDRMEAHDQADALADRVVAHILRNRPDDAVRLVQALGEAGAHNQLLELAERAAAHQPLDGSSVVAPPVMAPGLEAAEDRLVVLLAREPAAHFAAKQGDAVTWLMKALQEAGAHDQLTKLVARLPAAGRFAAFLDIDDHRERFTFGREPDGSAAAPWSWEDLE